MRATHWVLIACCWGAVAQGLSGSLEPGGPGLIKGRLADTWGVVGGAGAGPCHHHEERYLLVTGCGLLAGHKPTSGRLHLPRIRAPLCIRWATTGQNLNQKISGCRGDDGNSKRPFADSTVVIVSGRNPQQMRKSVGRMVMDNKRCASF